MTPDDFYSVRIERADRLAERELGLAAKEADLAIEERIHADWSNKGRAVLHQMAASMHEQAQSAHERAAEFQRQHADELRTKQLKTTD